jgi:hypothetical protein
MCSATEPASVTTPADELYRLPLAADVAQRPLRRCSNAGGRAGSHGVRFST